MKRKPNIDVKKKVFTLFILFFPTILIAIVPSFMEEAVYLPFAIKTLLAFYQFIILKNFIDTHYGI